MSSFLKPLLAYLPPPPPKRPIKGLLEDLTMAIYAALPKTLFAILRNPTLLFRPFALRRLFMAYVWDVYGAPTDQGGKQVKENLITPNARGVVLDLGAGHGHTIPYLSGSLVEVYVALEPNKSMHKHIRSMAKNYGYSEEAGTLLILSCGAEDVDAILEGLATLPPRLRHSAWPSSSDDTGSGHAAGNEQGIVHSGGPSYASVAATGTGTNLSSSMYSLSSTSSTTYGDASHPPQPNGHVLTGYTSTTDQKTITGVDTIISILTLCTVPEPQRTIQELAKHVLNPGGKLLYYEHVLNSLPHVAYYQKVFTPIWAIFFDGCKLDRDTEKFVSVAGKRGAGGTGHSSLWEREDTWQKDGEDRESLFVHSIGRFTKINPS